MLIFGNFPLLILIITITRSCHSYLIALTLKKITHSAENTPHLNVHNFDNSRDIRRLLVQLEETERRFDIVYKQHRTELECVLELRRFEVDFRELQVSFIKNILYQIIETHFMIVGQL